MINDGFNNPKKSLVLLGLDKKFKFLLNLHKTNKLPKVLMLSGNKGNGKFTLINHFLAYTFDEVNYILSKSTINDKTSFYKHYMNDLFPNIITLSGSLYKNVKIEDIRNLKSMLSKSSALSKKRFIILDDIELFNTNTLNALLKIIEEPSENNYFILINNKTKPLIETIYSRSIEIKIFLNNEDRIKIIRSLIEKNNINVLIDYKDTYISPGNFLLFNMICDVNSISPSDNIMTNLSLLLNLYKKKKEISLIRMILFLVDVHYTNLIKNKNDGIDSIIENKSFIISSINNYTNINLSQNSLLNVIKDRLTDG
jgi:DNA polymerase III subunit delta'